MFPDYAMRSAKAKTPVCQAIFSACPSRTVISTIQTGMTNIVRSLSNRARPDAPWWRLSTRQWFQSAAVVFIAGYRLSLGVLGDLRWRTVEFHFRIYAF